MSKVVVPKTTGIAGASLDASNVTVNGIDLTTAINTLIAENVSDDAQLAGCATIAGNNVFTGSNTIPALTIPSAMSVSSSGVSLTKLPRLVSTISPTDPNDLCCKTYVDSSVGAVPNILPLNNDWTGTNSYSVLPTCTALATSNSQMANKQYVDTSVNTAGLKAGANNWTSTNSYNVSLPTSIQTPTLNNQLTTKVYVDNTVNSLKTSANTWSAKQTVNNAVAVNTTHAGGYYDGNGNSVTPFTITDIDTGNNTNSNVAFIINGSNGSSQILSATGQVGGAFMRLNTWSNDTNGVSIGSNYTRIEGGTNHLTVDKTNGITMKVNPKIDSYVAPSVDVELCPKKFVDDSISNKTTFITTAGKGPTEGLNVVDNASSKGTIVVPYAGAGNYNPSVTDGSTAIIVRSNVIDTASLCIAPHSNTNTGIQLSTNSINIGCGGSGASAETNININGSSGIQFSKVPILTTDLTSTITTDNHLTNKKYVDSNINSVVNSVSPSVTYADKAFHFEYLNTSGTRYYGLYYPYTGNSGYTGNNSVGWYRNFYVNTTKDLLNCTIDLFSWQRINSVAVIGGATTRTGSNALTSNINVRTTPPFDPAVYIGGGSNTYYPITSTIVLSFLSGGFYATVLQSNKVGWKNASQVAQVFQSQYSPTSGVTRSLGYNGLTFSFQGANTAINPTSYNRVLCSVGYGNIINSPSANAGSCSEYGYTARITNNYDASGLNGAFITQIETSPPQTMDTTGW